MIINGIGVDIVENNRIKKLIINKNFIHRIFSKKEINNSKKIKDKTNYFAKRFAAKESLSKAIGIGFRKGLNFNDISVVNDKYGKPKYELNNKVKSVPLTDFNSEFTVILQIIPDIKVIFTYKSKKDNTSIGPTNIFDSFCFIGYWNNHH